MDPDTGFRDSSYETEAGIDSTPIVAGDAVFFSDQDAILLKESTGSSPSWDIQLRRNSESPQSAAVDTDTVYAISTENGVGSYLHAIDRTDDSQRWVHNFPNDETVYSSPVVDNHSVYVATGRELYIINTTSGEYTNSIYNRQATPSLVGESLYIGGSDSLYRYVSDDDSPKLSSVSRIDDTAIAATITDDVDVDESTNTASDFDLNFGSIASISSSERGTDTTVTISLDGGVDSDSIDVSVSGTIADRYGNKLKSGVQSLTGMDSVSPVAEAGTSVTADKEVPINFDASDSTDGDTVVSLDWSFGDRATDTGSTPSQTYTEHRTCTVELTVTDDAGNGDTDTMTVTFFDSSLTKDRLCVRRSMWGQE
jgi:hypothetical protein